MHAEITQPPPHTVRALFYLATYMRYVSRREWDSYLAPEQKGSASQIPRGWVVPTEPSCEHWKIYIKPKEHANSSNNE